MTKAQKLTAMTGENDVDVLSTYLDIAESAIVGRVYPFGDGTEQMPGKYDTLQVEIAAYMINKRGAEGETVHLENGVSRHFENGDIPISLLRRITPMAEVL